MSAADPNERLRRTTFFAEMAHRRTRLADRGLAGASALELYWKDEALVLALFRPAGAL